MNKLVSIITPCYNNAEVISDTIKSVLNQTYKIWELLIVDDCSSDESKKIIEYYCSLDNRIRYFRTDNQSGSPSLPRNIGIEHANGEIIAFLDSDDCWMPNKLERQLKFLDEKKLQFIFSDYEKMTVDGIRNNRFIHMPEKCGFWDILETCSIPCLTVMMKKDIIGDTRFKNIPKEDYDFWMEILKRGITAYNQGEVLALYREQPNSRSADKITMIKSQWFVLRKVQGVKRPLAFYFMMKYLFHGFLKYIK